MESISFSQIVHILLYISYMK